MSEHQCLTCNGEGNTDNNEDLAERSPWSYWVNLPVKSALAVILGVVKPTTCYSCKGTGVEPR